ncbi:hypothetical protein [Halapricum salinum]|uniref:Uncharacterized protein n=1 Tax=Halapricum salinum TaxID=1457250 RepID=A0A4D6HCW7_9EURY|nr:hypothetical protein [Halapricum salinum]QCC50567.1 hypothetical protein DV733_04605 [Halapricum salinum]
MQRTLALIAVALIVGLAGCSGGGSAGGNGDTTGGDVQTTADNGEATTTRPVVTTAASDEQRPEIAMFQFDRSEHYEYDVVYVDGVAGTTVVDVDVAGGEATINVTGVIRGEPESNVYTVPTNDPDAVVDAMEDDIRQPGLFHVLQAQDVSGIFVEQGITYEVGAEYRSFMGNVTVMGTNTIGGVDCLSYEYEIEGTILERGCLSPELELPVSWTKYFSDGTVRTSFTLVSYADR